MILKHMIVDLTHNKYEYNPTLPSLLKHITLHHTIYIMPVHSDFQRYTCYIRSYLFIYKIKHDDQPSK